MFKIFNILGVQKKEDIRNREFIDYQSFHHYLISDKSNYDIFEKQKQIRLEKTMTYIVSGKLNNKPFLMVDCVATIKKENNKTFHFRNKLKKLITTENETYYCFTGIDAYQHSIDAFDEKCYIKNEKFDFKNINHIDEILGLYKILVKRPEYNSNMSIINHDCRIYFINKDGVYYYNIDKNVEISDMFEIPNNKIIEPEDFTNTPIQIKTAINNNEDLISFCKQKILEVQDYGIDLKDKFSYVIFDNDKTIIDNSIKNNKELVLSIVGGKYGEIK